ncbi:hypothetical protein I4U23_009898 [Adineta vaga]|nr:hypothetical protein I4U23_009898 [Adineta vaga]
MTTTDQRYRIVGDVTVRGKTSTATSAFSKGKKVEIIYGNKKTTDFDNVSIIQSRQPLTPESPYFVVEVYKCDPDAILAVGIAPIDINLHTGQYNNSLGYHNNTGRVYTSWKVHANTLGLQYGKGNTVAVYVTYFGEHLSTALLYYDNFPVATRYHFETNKERFFPTITFSGGRVEIGVLWPEAVEQLPSISDIPVSQWIRAPMGTYDAQTGFFENPSRLEDLPVQAPVPLGKTFRYFVVTQQEVSATDGKGASVGLATYSPLKPTPTCTLMKDYYTWFAKMKMKVGNTIGWGVYYDDNCEDDKAEQLCLVYVMFNKLIVDVLFVLQPEGGFVPIVLLQPYATKVSIAKKNMLTADELTKLQGLYKQMLRPAIDIYRKDKVERDLPGSAFRKSDQVLLSITDQLCRVSIPKTENTIHYVQFRRPLTSERRFFFVELENISQQCQVTIGITSSDHTLYEAPGFSDDTVGYNAYTGKLYSNRKDIGNMRGHRCQKGDTVGLEIETFDQEMSVVLFSKNFRPIGTRYITLRDRTQFYPTIFIENAGDPVELLVYWQTRVSVPPHYSVRNPEDWCLPEGTKIDLKDKFFILPQHYDRSLCLQAPYSLHKKYNHFEIVLADKFSDNEPPPAIALCTASPLDPPPISQFKQDYLRFWPTGDAAKYLKQGDKIGWGVLFPQDEDSKVGKNNEQLIICYLTVNRTVGYVRVLYQPVGGLYPVVIAPPNVNRIKMDFSATRISTQDFTPEQIKTILSDAKQQIEAEQLPTKNSQSTTGKKNSIQPNNKLTINGHQSDMNSTTNYYSDSNVPATKSAACIIL